PVAEAHNSQALAPLRWPESGEQAPLWASPPTPEVVRGAGGLRRCRDLLRDERAKFLPRRRAIGSVSRPPPGGAVDQVETSSHLGHWEVRGARRRCAVGNFDANKSALIADFQRRSMSAICPKTQAVAWLLELDLHRSFYRWRSWGQKYGG